MALLLERLRPRVPNEPLVIDGLRTLEPGQYWPFDLNVLVGVATGLAGTRIRVRPLPAAL